nr:hypothetical protein CFP56_58661 [Quercus suber]
MATSSTSTTVINGSTNSNSITKNQALINSIIFCILCLGCIITFALLTFRSDYNPNPIPKVQVDSTSFLSVTNISDSQTTTTFNMVFSFRNARELANYPLLYATMYLHHDHKYLSDKGLPSFVQKSNEETQVKAEFRLTDCFLASDLASGEVNVDVELMATILVKLPFDKRVYVSRFICSDLKFAKSTPKVDGNWTILGSTITCMDVLL